MVLPTGTMLLLSEIPLTLGQMGTLAPLFQGALGATAATAHPAMLLDTYRATLEAGSEAGAREALGQILQAHGENLRRQLFAPKQPKPLQSLALQIRNSADDPIVTLNLLQPHGILSHGVAAVLRDRLSDSSNGKTTKVFLLQLGRIFSNPSFESFADVEIKSKGTEDILVRQYCYRENWKIISSFGRHMIVTKEEALLFRLLNAAGFMQESETGIAPALITTLPIDTLAPPPIEQPGDLMIAGARGLLRQELSVISYPLLRRVLFTRMAKEQFEETAALLLTISDPLVLSRLFADLRTFGHKEWGIPNSKNFFGMAFDYIGLTLGAMSPVEAAGLVTVLAERGRREKSEKELTRQLTMAFGSIHPSELERIPSTTGPLPFLSVLIGTLLETKETRRFAEEIVRVGLDPEHPSHRAFSSAMAHLDLRSENGAALEKRGLLERLLRKETRPLLFEPPATTLAKRQEIISRLQRRLNEVLSQDSISENQLSLLSDMILLTLTPSDVWQLVDGDAVKVTKLLRQQPSDVIVAFFKEWGSHPSDEEDFVKMGKVLGALWRSNGEKGRITTREAIRLALEDRSATTVMQSALSLHGTDGDLMTAQMELYTELSDTEHLGGAINPYDFFVVSGVLKPEDLAGRMREEAIANALWALKSLDQHGKIGMRVKYLSVDDAGGGSVWELDNKSGIHLEKEEQQAWRAKTVEMLVRLGANWREVTDYLISYLPKKTVLLERIGGTPQITPLDQTLNARERLYFEALDKLDPRRLTDKYLLPLFKKESVDSPIRLKILCEAFGLQHQSVQRLLLKLLRKEEKFYKNYGDPNPPSDENEVEATPAVAALIKQGDAGIDFLYGHLGRRTDEKDPTIGLRMFLFVAERIATPLAHQRIMELYFLEPSSMKETLLLSLSKIDSNPNYKGRKADDVYFQYLFGDFVKADLQLAQLACERLEESVGIESIAERARRDKTIQSLFEASKKETLDDLLKVIVTDHHESVDHLFGEDRLRAKLRASITVNPRLNSVVAVLATLALKHDFEAISTLFKLQRAFRQTYKNVSLLDNPTIHHLSKYLGKALLELDGWAWLKYATKDERELFRDPEL